MADIRFKISGSSEPFIAKLYCGASLIKQMAIDSEPFIAKLYCGASLIKQMAIDYSGTCCNSCNIIGNLYPNTTYSLSITDKIGNSISTGFTTPVQVGTTTLASKSICLSGTPYNCGVAFTCYLNSEMVISPSLSMGETLTLCFVTCTCGGGTCGVDSAISVSRCSSGSAWTPIISRSNSGVCAESPIVLCCGDKLCYSLSTIHSGSVRNVKCGCSILKLAGATAYGFNCNIINTGVTTSIYVASTTTTSTTTFNSIAVYIGSASNVSTYSYNKCVCAKICTSPPLTTGQGFRLCFTTNAHSSADAFPKPISACAWLYRTSCCNFACTVVGRGGLGGYCTDGGYCYIDVDCANIGNIVLCLVVRSNMTNDILELTNCATLSLNAISNTYGGTFVLSNNQCIWACSAYTDINDVCHPSAWGTSGSQGDLPILENWE